MDGAGNRGPIHLVNAWATANQLVLGQVRTSDKSDEITAIPELLRVLDLAGCIVTIDAMGCQKAIAADIIGQDAHYMLTLKENHPIIHREVRVYISSLPDLAAAEAAGTVRAPWGVENQLHWVLDVAFREDDARARKGHSSSRRPPRSGASRASGFGQGGTIDIYWRSSGIRCDRPAWSPPSILCLRSGCGC
jgi:predicted transposase YbfD/YdcC